MTAGIPNGQNHAVGRVPRKTACHLEETRTGAVQVQERTWSLSKQFCFPWIHVSFSKQFCFPWIHVSFSCFFLTLVLHYDTAIITFLRPAAALPGDLFCADVACPGMLDENMHWLHRMSFINV